MSVSPATQANQMPAARATYDGHIPSAPPDGPPPPPGMVTIQPGMPGQIMEMNQMAMQQPSITVQPGMMAAGQPIGQPGQMMQGQTAVWMPMIPPIQGVPQGLEYLTMVDTIIIQQTIEILELVTNWETKNKYILKNANSEQVYYAFEESAMCERQCCGAQRGWSMHMTDNFKREVMTVRRPFKCCGGCCCGVFACTDGCAQECTIEAPVGNVIGYVRQRQSCCSSAFHVQDESGNNIFTIDGPCCCLLCGCQDKEFPVKMGEEIVGEITKKWGGCIKEMYTKADTFSVSFPKDLDCKLKAILLGATFLIDFMEFEHPKNNNRHNN